MASYTQQPQQPYDIKFAKHWRLLKSVNAKFIKLCIHVGYAIFRSANLVALFK